MSHFIDDTEEVKIQDIGADWVQVQIKNQTYTLSYDAAVDLAMRFAMVTSKMDQAPNSGPTGYMN